MWWWQRRKQQRTLREEQRMRHSYPGSFRGRHHLSQHYILLPLSSSLLAAITMNDSENAIVTMHLQHILLIAIESRTIIRI